MDIKAHFKLLNLKPDASAEEVKSAYKKIVKRWHPDQFNNDPVKKKIAEEKLKAINFAYDSIKMLLATKPDSKPISPPKPKKPTPEVKSKPANHGKKPSPFEEIWLNMSETLRNILNSKPFKSFITGKSRTGSHSQTDPKDNGSDKPKTFDDILRERMASSGRTERMRQARKRRNAYMLRQMKPASRKGGRKPGPISPISKVRPVHRVERIGGDS